MTSSQTQSRKTISLKVFLSTGVLLRASLLRSFFLVVVNFLASLLDVQADVVVPSTAAAGDHAPQPKPPPCRAAEFFPHPEHIMAAHVESPGIAEGGLPWLSFRYLRVQGHGQKISIIPLFDELLYVFAHDRRGGVDVVWGRPGTRSCCWGGSGPIFPPLE